jgi:hypothetical protein
VGDEGYNGGSTLTVYFQDNESSTPSANFTFALNSSGSTLNLTQLVYHYSSSDNSGSIDWNLNGYDLGSTAISSGSPAMIDLTKANGDATGTSFTLVGTLTGRTLGNPDTGANGPGLSFTDFSITAVTAVPEPVNYALAGFGLLFVGGSAGRYYLARRRSATAS